MQSNVGLIPRICEALFSRVGEDENKVTYTAKVRFVQIKNTRVCMRLRAPPQI